MAISRYLICVFLWIVPYLIFPQSTLKKDLNPKELKLFNDAKISAQNGNYEKSNNLFEKLLRSKPSFTEGILRLASNYYSLLDREKAETLFTFAISLDPEYDPEMYYSLAKIQMENKNYKDAAENFDKYVIRQKENKIKSDRASSLRDNMLFIYDALKNPVPFEPISLGPNINTVHSEYSPSLSMDGNTLIFTRNLGQEDFYVSMRDTIGFTQGSPLTGMNTVQNEGAHSISADGKFMVFTSCDRKDAYGSCDLYYSLWSNGKWTIPVNMGHKVNSAAWDTQPTLSSDGRTLYFSSNRLGTHGGSDIWMTYRNEKNAWVEPVNLGPVINTAGNEETPFLHADGQTLYFRSNGRPGMGGFDIYISRRDLEIEQWGEPVNIGYPINTEGAEGGFIVSLDGSKAFFASDNDIKSGVKLNQLDLFSFDLYEAARPKSTTFVKGNITDGVTGKSLKANVTIKDLKSGKNVFQVKTGDDGYFIGGVTVGHNYACIVEKEGYIYYTDNFDMTDVKVLYEPYFLNIKLTPVPKKDTIINSKPIVLRNIFFRSGSAELLPESDHEIALLSGMLKENQVIKILITGHTDNVGNDGDNLILSRLRAKSVSDALVKSGIDSSRITSEGKGEIWPIDSNDTETGRHNNRRTEFVILNSKL
ncbi:MAG: PD40 domain-containing protein [Saprospiraceae bacterium]|nr:PD40 domain-containing protein [Saprospiraceae bacterium]